jgi:DNA-binding transcriptional ArsR family regulator
MTTADVPRALDSPQLDRLAASFRGLAHPTRLRILVALRDEEILSPVQMVRQIEPDIGLAHVAYHTRALVEAGLVAPAGTRTMRSVIEHFYTLSPRAHGLLELVDALLRGREPSN